MAKLPPGIHFSGTIGTICFYEVRGHTYARTKSSLTSERVLKNKEFASTRKYAGDMGRASKIGSLIYQSLPADIRGRWIFRAITGEAASLLYAGKEEEEVIQVLSEKYIQATSSKENEQAKPTDIQQTTPASPARSSKKANRRFKTMFKALWEQQGKPARYFDRAWKPGKRFNPDTVPRRSEYFLGERRN